jgi:hypothetical protein
MTEHPPTGRRLARIRHPEGGDTTWLRAVMAVAVAGAARAATATHLANGHRPEDRSIPLRPDGPVRTFQAGRDVELVPDRTVPAAVDIAIDVGLRAAAVADGLMRLATPAVRFALSPPLPRQFQLQTYLDAMAARGQAARTQADQYTMAFLAELVPAVINAVLDRIDLTQLVLDRVDMDRVIAAVDLDGITERIDVDRVAGRLDLDRVASRMDVDAVADRLDLDRLIDRFPLDRILARVDIDEIASRIDLDAIVARVDIDSVAARIDVPAIIDRLDLAALANQVIEQIDLPDLIRESSGAMASETLRGVRMQGMHADDRVNRIVDRVLLRRDRNDHR